MHRKLGPGFLESVHENAFCIELHKSGPNTKRQVEVPALYDGVAVGRHPLDLLVEDRIIVERKAVKEFEDAHFAVVKPYLKAAGLKHGPLLNFAKPTLKAKRVISGK